MSGRGGKYMHFTYSFQFLFFLYLQFLLFSNTYLENSLNMFSYKVGFFFIIILFSLPPPSSVKSR